MLTKGAALCLPSANGTSPLAPALTFLSNVAHDLLDAGDDA